MAKKKKDENPLVEVILELRKGAKEYQRIVRDPDMSSEGVVRNAGARDSLRIFARRLSKRIRQDG